MTNDVFSLNGLLVKMGLELDSRTKSMLGEQVADFAKRHGYVVEKIKQHDGDRWYYANVYPVGLEPLLINYIKKLSGIKKKRPRIRIAQTP